MKNPYYLNEGICNDTLLRLLDPEVSHYTKPGVFLFPSLGDFLELGGRHVD